MSDERLRGRGVALVTGGSRGIGRVVALRLARLGYSVAINYRSAATEASAVVDAIQRDGGIAMAFRADVANIEESSALVPTAEDRLGPVQVLVNNAGITRDRLMLQMSLDDWHSTWDTDLVGTRILARAALRAMRPRGQGRIVNVSSVVGPLGNAGQANYAAAKSAVQGFTRELAVEAAAAGITVNCVIPGYVETDATSHLTEEQREAWLRRIPMRRPTTTEAIADMILFLASDQAAYVTGQCVAVDGGLLAAAGHGFASA